MAKEAAERLVSGQPLFDTGIQSMRPLNVSNPYTGNKIAELHWAAPPEIRSATERATRAFSKWRHSPAWERSRLLTAVSEELQDRRDEFAELIRDEAGKPITFARIEVERALGVLRWGAAEAQRYAGELLRLDAARNGRSGFGIHARFPRGIVLGITPFNFPLNLVLHKVVPAIASGCTILIKPSPATPLTAMRLASIFERLHPGLMQTVLADDESTAALTQAPEVAMVSFTGSAAVGWRIRSQAPRKPVTLELGGNAWVLLLEDTPESGYAAIARRIAGAGFGYAGQSCISVQNIAVAQPGWKKFRDALAEATAQSAYGDPSDEKVLAGPLIRSRDAERIRGELARAPGSAERITSSTRSGPETPTICAPTSVLLSESWELVPSGSLTDEEIFGPVVTAAPFRSLEELARRINSGRYGLQAGVFTQHWPSIDWLYRELEVGGLVVNDVPTTRYDHQPYGGVKDSGEGREGIRYAMDEMTTSKFLSLSAEIPPI